MEKIRIGDTVMTAGVRCAGGTLSLNFPGARIEEIAALLTQDGASQIRELTAAGTTKAIYQNHALTRVYAETIAGTTYVHAVLQTEKIEKSEAEALREELAALRGRVDALSGQSALLSEKVKALLAACGLGGAGGINGL